MSKTFTNLLLSIVMLIFVAYTIPITAQAFSATDVVPESVTIEPDVSGEYKIAWVSDIHICADTGVGVGVDRDNLDKVLERRELNKRLPDTYANEMFEHVIDYLNSSDVNCVVFGGDIIDYYSDKNISALKSGLNRLNKPYMYIRADHDYYNYYDGSLSSSDVRKGHASIDGGGDIKTIKLGDDLEIVGIDNSTSPISDSTLRKLKDKLNSGKKIIIATHVPYNTPGDNRLQEVNMSVQGKPYYWDSSTYPVNNTMREWLDLVYDSDNVVGVLAGHMHTRFSGKISSTANLEVFGNSTLGTVGLINVKGKGETPIEPEPEPEEPKEDVWVEHKGGGNMNYTYKDRQWTTSNGPDTSWSKGDWNWPYTDSNSSKDFGDPSWEKETVIVTMPILKSQPSTNSQKQGSVEFDTNYESTGSGESSSSTTVKTEDGDVNVTVNDKINVDISITQKTEIHFSSVPQLYDYESVVYSANNYIEKCFWKPRMEEVPDLEAWVMKNAKANSAYTGFWNLDITPPNKLYEHVGRECEVLGYDAIVSSESVNENGEYNAILMNEDAISRADALMLMYKSMNQWCYNYKIINREGKNVMVWVSRSNVSDYLSRAAQDGIINPYDNNGSAIKAGDFIITIARLMQQYGEPVMNETETNMLLQVYGETVPIGYGQEVSQAYCYLKARGVLNVELNPMSNITLADALNICMAVYDRDSRTNYKEIQLTHELSNELITKGYFKRGVTFDSPDASMYEEYDYSKAKYFDYFLRIDDNFPGFKTSGGAECLNVFISNTLDDNEGQYPGAYSKGKYTDIAGNTYYHFIVPVDYSYSYVTVNSYYDTDVPLYVNLPRGGGVYYLQSKNEGNSNWSGQATKMSFSEADVDPWEGFVDDERYGKELAKAVDTYNLFDYIAAAFKPMTAYAADFNSRGNAGYVWEFSNSYNNSIRTLYISVNGRYNDNQAIGSSIEDELKRVIKFMNEDADWRKAMNVQGQAPVGLTVSNQVGGQGKVYKVTQAGGSSGGNDILTQHMWNDAFAKVRDIIIKEEASQLASANAQANTAYNATASSSSITNDVFSSSAICSYTGEGALVAYRDLQKSGLFISGSVPQPDANGVLTLYSTSNYIVKLNQNDHTIMVGSTVYKLSDDCAMFYYETAQDLYVDFRVAYGWGSYKKVFYKQSSTSGQGAAISLDTSSNKIESYQKSLYSYPYDKVSGGNATAFKVLCVNRVNAAYTDSVNKLLLTSAVPMANWVTYNGYDKSTSKSIAYLFVYYPTSAWKYGASGVPSASEMETATEQAKTLQQQLLGYSVYKGDEWYVRAFDITDATDTDEPGKVGFNYRVGLYYNVPKSGSYSHTEYLNGNLYLPLYSCIPSNSGNVNNDVIICANINASDNQYGIVYDYKMKGQTCYRIEYNVFNVSGNSPMGKGSDEGNPLPHVGGQASPDLQFKVEDLAPSGVYAYFGGFPKEYVTTGNIGSYKNATYYLGSLNVNFNSSSSLVKDYVLLGYMNTSLKLLRNDATKFYKVASDGSHDVYVFMGNTLNVSVDLDESELSPDVIYDADSLNQYFEWDKFSLEYLLHKIDEGTTWAIVFIFKVVPLVAMIAIMILLGFSFISQFKITQLLAKKLFDPVKILTFGRATMKDWTFRRGFGFMMVAFILIALFFNGNLLKILQWTVEQYQGLVDIIKTAF